MLGWLFLGLATALQDARTSEGHHPVYLLNSDTPSGTSEIVGGSVAPDLVNYFLGECFDSSPESNQIIRRLVYSPMMRKLDPAVVIVENIEPEFYEKKLGSPLFYLEGGSSSLLEDRSTKSSVASLKNKLLKRDEHVFAIDALQSGIDHNEVIWQTLEQLSGVNVMLIGTQRASKLEPSGIKAASMRADDSSSEPHLPFNKIPNFFESEEECLSLTNDCSSRGSCVKSSNGLYACKCKATVEGDRTHYWGGSDCSKRDVSTQFNLIVGTGVAIVIAAVLSIQLLFNLGSEPLPGILDTSSLKS